MSDFSNRLMVESNANLVRWMHVTPWKQDVESCDRVGLMQAMPAGDSEKDVDGRRWEQRVEVMRDAIIYNRNNPSIVFYESGNKGISEEHMRQMKALRDQYDPHGGRAVGLARDARQQGRRVRRRDALHQQERAAADVGDGVFARRGAPQILGRVLAALSQRRRRALCIKGRTRAPTTATRTRTRSRTSCAGTTTGASGRARARASSAGGVNIVFSDSNTHHRGAENYRRSGEVDAVRMPKDGFFAHQVMWDGWVDVERPRTHIIGHWNYEPGTKKNVYVVSSAEKVELFVNGKSLGFGEQSSRFLFTFKQVAWQPGTLKAVGYDARGKQISEATKKTAGQPAAIRLTAHTWPRGLRADGADVALVDVEVVDAAGQPLPDGA